LSNRLDRLFSGALTLAAVAIAAALIHREFFARPNVISGGSPGKPPELMANWSDLLKTSVVLGDSGAPVKVIEFMDLECPFCKGFNSRARALRQKYGRSVAVAIIHFPLEMHRFARPAARAAECAGERGRFEQFLNLVYERQDSIGLKSWASFAREAGVPDTVAFLRCVSASAAVPRIEAGLALGQRIGVTGTPTVIINGWRYFSPPDSLELDRAVSALLAGRSPYKLPPNSGKAPSGS
jgi:protein-disulfide isomerase